MAAASIDDVSDTAFWIAHLRALESERGDALFRDTYARTLAGERGRDIAAAMPLPRVVGWTVAIRTWIIDHYIESAVAQGVDTVLNLGAGLDTRPYRMNLPASLTWVEADYPHIIEYKESILAGEQACCRLERVKVDLAAHARRQDVLANINARASRLLVLTEGVVPYLSVEEVASLADELRALDHVLYWIVDYFSAQAMQFRRGRRMQQAMQNAPFRFTPPDWLGFFRQHGWQVKEMRYLAEEAQQLQRPVPLPSLMKLAVKTTLLFAPERRRKAVMQSMGYALLVPC